MTPETPLVEVAMILPTEAAQVVSALPMDLQQSILEYVRSIICLWEQSGVDLDPITFSKVLTPVVEAMCHICMSAVYVIQKQKEQS